ncbi:MAG: helix-turn-helix domain-containing protein [Sulfurimonas sp.]|nr:helix-turn-helix domain-containing protein [Sulfurimonas sp.]
MKYTQLTLSKRYHISTLNKQGYSQKYIAHEVEVHPSTICRELRRNNDVIRGYNAEFAQIKSTKTEMRKKKRFGMFPIIET